MPETIIAYNKASEISSSNEAYSPNHSLAYLNAAYYTEAEKAQNLAIELNGSEEYMERLDEIKKWEKQS